MPRLRRWGGEAAARRRDDPGTGLVGQPDAQQEHRSDDRRVHEGQPQCEDQPQPGEFASYWDKLATQTAGGTAPDIIQMDMNYISEYGTRGALLDLGKVDTSKFVEGTVDSGKINDKLVGSQCRHQQRDLLRQPQGLREGQDGPARRQDLDLGLDDGGRCRGRLQGGSALRPGAAVGSDPMFGTFVRQRGKELFKPDGLGFDVEDAQAWYDLMLKGQKAKALGTAEQISEESAKPLDQSAIVLGTAACSTTTPISWKRSAMRPGAIT